MKGWQSSAGRLGASALIALGAAQVARAANFEVLRLPGYENVMILMNGEVTEGDAQHFANTGLRPSAGRTPPLA
jgi:hypothetical protein